MKKKLHTFMAAFMAAAVLLLSAGILAGCQKETTMLQYTDTAMGTMLHQTLYVTKQDNTIVSECVELLDGLEQNYLSWRLEGSELYAVNQSAGDEQGIELSEKLLGLISECRKITAESAGAFDITIGSVVQLWGIDRWADESAAGFAVPDEEEIITALKASGAAGLVLKENRVWLKEGMQLDLGAAGKGIALDELMLLLKQHEEVTGAVISVGGSVLTYGSRPDGKCWRVAVVNPMNTQESLGVLSVTGESYISTSGDYERYVEKNGRRYHHIINPATGMPADSGVRSVTIVADNGLYSDALSTACFVLGAEEGMRLAERLGVEALFVTDDGELVMTEGMERIFESADQ